MADRTPDHSALHEPTPHEPTPHEPTPHEPTPHELAHTLRGVSFPASRAQLIEAATAHDADSETLRRLHNIEDHEYSSPDEVSAAVTFDGDTTTRYGHVTSYDQ